MPLTIKAPQVWQNEPAKTTPINAARLEWNEARTTEIYNWLVLSGQAYSVKEAPFNAKGDGVTDDTIAIQAAINAAGPPGEQGAVFFPPGQYFVSSALKIPELLHIGGLNQRITEIVAHGEFNLFEVTGTGDVNISGLFLKCATPQTVKGAAIDLEHGFVANIEISQVRVGSNFFNGFNCVGSGEIGNIFIKDILVEEFTGGVKSYGHAFFVFGSATNTKRTVAVNMLNIKGHAAKQGDMPKWFQVRNTDSLYMNTCGFQNGLEGFNVGESDTSTQGTTNVCCEGVWFDGGAEGMTVGWRLNSCFSADFVGCHAQGCSPGVFVVGDVIATWTGGKVYHNYGSGFWFTASMKGGSSFNIVGCTIADNCEAKGAAVKEQCGVFAEKGASGWSISASSIGNFTHYGGGFQKYGVYIETTCKNINIDASNRIPAKGTASETAGWNLTKGVENLSAEASVKIGAFLES